MNISTLSQIYNLMKMPSLLSRLFKRNFSTPVASIAAKKKKLVKAGPALEKRQIPVETDVNKLVNYVCGSNILKTGSDIKLKPDSEYPDWLWTLNVDRIIPLEEMDPNSKQYHRRLRRMALRRNNQLAKLKKF